MFKTIRLVLVIFTIWGGSAYASDYSEALAKVELELKGLFNRMAQESNQTQKDLANQEFAQLFRSTLQQEGAFDYPFDSLVNVGKQKSDDNVLRILTWNLPQPRGLQKYFGYLMVLRNGQVKVFELKDTRGEFESPHLEIGSPSKWFGALYYEIVTQHHNNKTFYTLLGVDLNNIFSSKRIIEILTLENGEPVFGAPMVRLRDRMISRVIFEYSSRATMTLRWDNEHKMIISSHLIPMQPTYVGKFQYYVPDSSYDGFAFNNGCWVYTPDIDARNPLRDSRPKPVQPPVENFDPGFLHRSGRGSQ